MNIHTDAFSYDGYLVRQELLTNVPYGSFSSAYSGCGWIAAFNYLKAKQQSIPPDTVISQMEKWLLFGGIIGTNVFYLYAYLMKKLCCPLCLKILTRAAVSKQYIPHCGILMYFTGQGFHFVTFIHIEQGRYRFLNVNGLEDNALSLHEFLSGYCRFPLLFLITDPS